jgi:hypothetical protein
LKVADRERDKIGTRYEPTDGVIFRELEHEMVLLNPRSATYFSLNRSGTQAWALLDRGATIHEVCTSIAGSGNAPEARVMDDLRAFVAELIESDLMRQRESSG